MALERPFDFLVSPFLHSGMAQPEYAYLEWICLFFSWPWYHVSDWWSLLREGLQPNKTYTSIHSTEWLRHAGSVSHSGAFSTLNLLVLARADLSTPPP